MIVALLLLCTTIAVASADTITLPAALSELGEAAFQNDSSIDSVIVADGITEIKDLTFAGSSLREIHLPASVTSIAPTAFDNCSGVQFYVQNQYTKNWAENHGFTAIVDATGYAATDSVEISSFTVTNCNASFVLTVETTQMTADSGYRLGVQFSRTEADINNVFRTEPTLRTIPMSGGNDRVTIDLAAGYEGYVRAVLVDGNGSVITTGRQTLLIRLDSDMSGYVELRKDEVFRWSDTADQHFYFVAPASGVYAFSGTNMSEIRTMDKDSLSHGAGGDSSSYRFGTRLEAGEVLYIRASNANALSCSILVEEELPIRIDSQTVEGKTYRASYYGSEDMSSWHDSYSDREFWRLEDAYSDFSNHSQTGNWLPSSNYPMLVEAGQVFLIRYTLKCNGGTEYVVMRCDGDYRNGMLNTHEILVDNPLDTVNLPLGSKTYTATYYGERDTSQWGTFGQTFSSMKVWRLENAYDDFKNCDLSNSNLTENCYMMPIEAGQVFVVDLTLSSGGIQRQYMRCDGDRVSDGRLTTHSFFLP